MATTILIADDEEDILSALALTLEDEGYAVTTAATGAAALAELERHEPNLLITDEMMPHLSGSALVRRVRAREHEEGRPPPPPLPIIVMSAAAPVADLPESVFLAKPFDLGAVVALVARLLAD